MAYLDDVRALLAASTTVDGNTGWPLYLGHMPDSTAIGNKAVAALQTAGGPRMVRVTVEEHGLQVVVRGEPINQTSTGYEETEARAVLIHKALHGFAGEPSTASTVSRFAGVFHESGPFFGGYDEEWRPFFSANYRIWREST